MKLYLQRTCHKPDFEIICKDNEILNSIQLFFDENITRHKSENCCSISIIKENKNIFINYDGKNIISNSPISELSKIIYSQTSFNKSVFALHAGAVSYLDKNYIFIAPTSNGKTTLVSYLINRGFNYINDDCILIDMNSMNLIPYYKPIHLRHGGLKILKDNGIEIETKIIYDGDNILRYSFIPEKYPFRNLSIDGIFFIELNMSKNAIESLTKKDIFLGLLKSPIKSNNIDKEYFLFLKKLSNVYCKKIIYNDLEFVRNYAKNIEI